MRFIRALFLTYTVILLFYALNAKAEDIIKVMIIDTPIDRNHTLLSEPWRVIGFGKDTTPEAKEIFDQHGTHVAGIVLYGNSLKSSKKDILCPQVTIYPCKGFGRKLGGAKASIRCLQRAELLGINYINYSGGGYEYSSAEKLLLKNLIDRGVTVVVSAGNENSNLKQNPFYPASYKNEGIKLKVVGNGKNKKTRYLSSNWDINLIWRPGMNILSTGLNNSYLYMSGTSQAAPMYLHDILKKRCRELELAKRYQKR